MSHKLVVKRLASNKAEHNDLADRIVAFQKCSDAPKTLIRIVRDLAFTSTKEIEPIIAFYECMGMVLDEPDKYMYSIGQDEECKALQEEAWEMNDLRRCETIWRHYDISDLRLFISAIILSIGSISVFPFPVVWATALITFSLRFANTYIKSLLPYCLEFFNRSITPITHDTFV
ncbi:hypothetical protein K504DRAFT_114519 [Pleomassaria siparia CBS 279.74]|uniref:Uncharacterized protein n=1 Tax=Pleomassaria siparia CBS 279.74 TaxID=1314801 RepID=A0A6G1JV09_9PLEO|nr:hypothetical protein K504DRAFT_114519 [Pleomassaria siparia CBS 279.74]